MSKKLPPRVKNIIGNEYGRWTVIDFSHTEKGHSYWVCECECGTTRTHQRSHIVSSGTKSCGCLTAELTAERNRTHGMSDTTEYNSWRAMKERCQNENSTKYHLYGERGIEVCERWQRFENFIADMGMKPTPDHTLHRIDNDGDYEPDNCRWASLEEQANNRSNNHEVTIDGKTRTVAQWRRHFGVSKSVYDARVYQLGWSVTDALTTPIGESPS